MNYRVKIEKLGEQGYFELISVGTAKEIDDAYQQALDKIDEYKQSQQEQEIK